MIFYKVGTLKKIQNFGKFGKVGLMQKNYFEVIFIFFLNF